MTLFLCHQGNPKKTATNGDVLEPNLWKPSSSLLSPTTGAAISKKHGGPNQPPIPAKQLRSGDEEDGKRTKQSTKSDP